MSPSWSTTSKKWVDVLERYTRTDLRYLLQGGSWLFAHQAFATLASFAVAVAFGHLASQDTYGNYKYALSVASLLGVLSLTGLSTAVMQAAARGKEGVLSQGFDLSLRWSVGVFVVGLCAALYYYVQDNKFAAAALAISSVLGPLINSFSLYDAFQIGLRKFRLNAIYGTILVGGQSIALLSGLLLGVTRAIHLVVLYFGITLIITSTLFILVRRRIKNQEREPELFKFGSHVSLMNVVSAIADRFDSVIVFTLLGPVQLAIYMYALAMPEQIKNILKIIGPLSMPKFANRSMDEIHLNIWRRILQLSAILLAVLLAYIFAAPYIFKYLFPIYTEAVWYSQIYALSIVCGAFIYPIMAVLQSHKRTRALYISSNVPAIVLIILLPTLTYQYGLMGAIMSQIFYRIINASVHAWQFARLAKGPSLS